MLWLPAAGAAVVWPVRVVVVVGVTALVAVTAPVRVTWLVAVTAVVPRTGVVAVVGVVARTAGVGVGVGAAAAGAALFSCARVGKRTTSPTSITLQLAMLLKAQSCS